jgi:xylan 1,4-beta-xylosidase
MYSSYTAASFPRIWALAEKRRVNLEGVLTWAFEFEDQPWFAGYRQLSTNGVDLPVLNVFRLFARLGEHKLPATSSGQVALEEIVANGVRGERSDVGTLATRDADGRIAVLLWNYHDDDLPGPDAAIQLSIAGLKGKAVSAATVWRVDKEHANAFTAWQKMGAPQSPNERQYVELEQASKMAPETLQAQPGASRGGVSFKLSVPRQGVALVVLETK